MQAHEYVPGLPVSARYKPQTITSIARWRCYFNHRSITIVYYFKPLPDRPIAGRVVIISLWPGRISSAPLEHMRAR